MADLIIDSESIADAAVRLRAAAAELEYCRLDSGVTFGCRMLDVAWADAATTLTLELMDIKAEMDALAVAADNAVAVFAEHDRRFASAVGRESMVAR